LDRFEGMQSTHSRVKRASVDCKKSHLTHCARTHKHETLDLGKYKTLSIETWLLETWSIETWSIDR